MNNTTVAQIFWILRQKFPKSYHFEKNKVRRLDMQISTDLCVTVQLYSLCLLLAGQLTTTTT